MTISARKCGGYSKICLAHEERLDKAARLKIESQRRIIPEGTPEWNILYHKYYNEEVKKLATRI